MKFIEAAYEVLKEEDGRHLHYGVITSRARLKGLLETRGRTPGATMGAKLYTDTQNPGSRFRRGVIPGTFELKVNTPDTIQLQIRWIQEKFCKVMRKQLHSMPPVKFEELIRLLLDQMGFEETETTPVNNDGGVDVRGILRSNPFGAIKLAIQVKRWNKNVGAKIVRELRGSLKGSESEQGLIITPGSFTQSAINESQSEGKTPIRLINGDQLVELLIQYRVGVKPEPLTIPTLDTDFWKNILEVEPIEALFPSNQKSATVYLNQQMQLPLQPLTT